VFLDAGALFSYGVFAAYVGMNSLTREPTYGLGFRIDMD